jgi:hypothetical protein
MKARIETRLSQIESECSSYPRTYIGSACHRPSNALRRTGAGRLGSDVKLLESRGLYA